MSFSSWFANTPNKPDAQSVQPQQLEGPSVTKDMTQGSQTVPSEPAMPETEPTSTADKPGSEPVVASAGEQEKQHDEAQPAAPAPATNSQAPVSTPPTSDEKAPPTSDLTAPHPPADPATVPGTTLKSGPASEPLNEKAEEPAPTMTIGGPPEPDTSAIDQRRQILLRKHTRLARFYTWLLLLGFVVLPSTFGKIQRPTDSTSDCTALFNDNRNSLGSTPLFPIGYVCCILNILGTYWLWRQRPNEAGWLFTNLFFPGLTNAFSGLVTTLASAFGAHGGVYSPASKTTLAFAIICTIVYGALSLIYRRRAIHQRTRRSSTSVIV